MCKVFNRIRHVLHAWSVHQHKRLSVQIMLVASYGGLSNSLNVFWNALSERQNIWRVFVWKIIAYTVDWMHTVSRWARLEMMVDWMHTVSRLTLLKVHTSVLTKSSFGQTFYELWCDVDNGFYFSDTENEEVFVSPQQRPPPRASAINSIIQTGKMLDTADDQISEDSDFEVQSHTTQRAMRTRCFVKISFSNIYYNKTSN